MLHLLSLGFSMWCNFLLLWELARGAAWLVRWCERHRCRYCHRVWPHARDRGPCRYCAEILRDWLEDAGS